MKLNKRRHVFAAVSTLFILLLTLQDSYCNNGDVEDIEPCFVNVIKSKLVFFNFTNETLECCDSWCTMKCLVNVTVVQNMTVYYNDPQCCPGYHGEACIPYCSESCGYNKQCSQPEECTCITGWSGNDCQRVANLTLLNITSSSIQLSWLSPTNSNDNGYVSYCSNTTNTPRRLFISNNTKPTGHNTTIITGLRPYTIYKCCVIPVLLNGGNGTESCLMQLQTLQSVPSTTPVNLMLSHATNSSLLIQWAPPITPNGIISHYILRINYNNSTLAVLSINGQFRYYLLSGLSVDQIVAVNISASTAEGEGPVSNTLTKVVVSSVLLTPFTPTIDKDLRLLTVTHHQNSTHTTLTWIPPTSLHNTASYYVLVLSSDSQDQRWTIGSRQMFNLTLLIEQFIPHQFNATVITTDRSTALISSDVFFAQEGTPRSSPIIQSMSRNSPTSANVTWLSLPLTNSSGFITNYTLIYTESTSNLSCGNIITDTTKKVVTTGRSVLISDLNIHKAYCLNVQASTNVGPGLTSNYYLIPTFESNEFCLIMEGVYNCSTWILTDLNEKLSNLTLSIINALNSVCSCRVSVEHIVRDQISCVESGNHRDIKYCSRLIGTELISSLSLIEHLKDWSTNSQDTNSIILSGLTLAVTSICNSLNGNCTDTNTGDIPSQTDYYKVTALILGISLVLALVFQVLTCLLLMNYCNKYYKKKSNEPLQVPHLSMYSSSDGSTRNGSDSPECIIQSKPFMMPPEKPPLTMT